MADELLNGLVSRSSITRVQVETINLRKRVLAGQLKLVEAAGLRGGGPVRVGTFYRVLDQAKNNVERSIFSVLLAIRLGVLKPEELNRLFSLVSQPGEVDQEAAMDIMRVLNPLIRRLVML
jgi:hypothetical protein